MTWEQRSAAGIPAEKFQETLKAKLANGNKLGGYSPDLEESKERSSAPDMGDCRLCRESFRKPVHCLRCPQHAEAFFTL